MTSTSKPRKYHDAIDRKREPRAAIADPRPAMMIEDRRADGVATFRELTDAEAAAHWTSRAVSLHRSLSDGSYRADAYQVSDDERAYLCALIASEYDEDASRQDAAYLISMGANAARSRAAKPARADAKNAPTTKADAAPDERAVRDRARREQSRAWATKNTEE